MLLLAADKGYGDATLDPTHADPRIVQHGSMMVNFGAIAAWVRDQGGRDWQPQNPPSGLYVAAFAFGLTATRHCDQAHADHLDQGGPDDHCALILAAQNLPATLPLDQALGYIRLSGFDPVIAPCLLPSIRTGLKTATQAQKQALAKTIEQLAAWHFPIGEASDLFFDLGVIALEIEQHRLAVPLFRRSLAAYGADAACLINLALCHHRMQEWKHAQAYLHQGLQRDPENAMGLLLRQHIEWAMLAETQSPSTPAMPEIVNFGPVRP